MTAGGSGTSWTGVWVLGGFQTDFARNLTREGRDVADLVGEVVDGTLAATPCRGRPTSRSSTSATPSASCSPARATSARCRRRSRPELWGVPAARHEAACASGGIARARRHGRHEAGRYDVALVLGVELEKTVPGDEAAAHLGAAAWVGHEGEDARSCGRTCSARSPTSTTGATASTTPHLRAIAAAQLRATPRSNPNAQTRGWDVPDLTGSEATTTPPTRSSRAASGATDCSQVTDGGAGVVLRRRRVAARHPGARRRRRRASLGWGHRTVGLGAAPEARPRPATTPTSCRTCAGPSPTRSTAPASPSTDLDGIETHDCFTPTRVPRHRPHRHHRPGESWKAIENGVDRDGRHACRSTPAADSSAAATRWAPPACACCSTRPSRSAAPPATTRSRAPARFGTLNIGGSTATTVSLVVGAVAD